MDEELLINLLIHNDEFKCFIASDSFFRLMFAACALFGEYMVC